MKSNQKEKQKNLKENRVYRRLWKREEQDMD